MSATPSEKRQQGREHGPGLAAGPSVGAPGEAKPAVPSSFSSGQKGKDGVPGPEWYTLCGPVVLGQPPAMSADTYLSLRAVAGPVTGSRLWASTGPTEP